MILFSRSYIVCALLLRRPSQAKRRNKRVLTTVKQVFFLFTNGGILSGYQSLQALHLSGSYSHQTGIDPLAVETPRQPTLYTGFTGLASLSLSLSRFLSHSLTRFHAFQHSFSCVRRFLQDLFFLFLHLYLCQSLGILSFISI